MLGHAELARLVRTPICLDESDHLGARRRPRRSASAPAGSSTSSPAGSAATWRRAGSTTSAPPTASPVWCGGMLETGIGRAANVALAALPGFTLPGDTSASDRYYRTDITEPFVLQDGHLPVPTGPGLGVTPLPDQLSEVTVATEWLPC